MFCLQTSRRVAESYGMIYARTYYVSFQVNFNSKRVWKNRQEKPINKAAEIHTGRVVALVANLDYIFLHTTGETVEKNIQRHPVILRGLNVAWRVSRIKSIRFTDILRRIRIYVRRE